MQTVRTVLGDIPAMALGRTDYHEHLFHVSPLLPGDELDDEWASGEEASLLRNSGFESMVEATPTGLGRDPAAMARISLMRGLNIVATTGAHREVHYPSEHWLLGLTDVELGERFAADVKFGLAQHDEAANAARATAPSGMPVRAGMLKAGISYWKISTFERRVLAGVAHAHHATGAPVMVHLEHGSAAFELLEILLADGVSSDAVVLAHVDRNPDPMLHADIAAAGAYLGYDGFARSRTWPDSLLLDCFVRAAEHGASRRLLLGGDVARRTRYVAYGGMPGMAYLGQRIIRRLLEGGNDDLVEAALVSNPARLLARFTPIADNAIANTNSRVKP
jgi:predicted metal-dependent phosphotriesterase family hydrolase